MGIKNIQFCIFQRLKMDKFLQGLRLNVPDFYGLKVYLIIFFIHIINMISRFSLFCCQMVLCFFLLKILTLGFPMLLEPCFLPNPLLFGGEMLDSEGLIFFSLHNQFNALFLGRSY